MHKAATVLMAPAVLIASLAGCTVPDTSDLAPPSATAKPPGGYSLPPDPRIMPSQPSVALANRSDIDLPTLIDIAETNNPATRSAWKQAKAAASAVGLVDAAYVPRLSAEVLAGYQQSSASALQDPLGILPSGTVTTGVGVGAAVLSAQWLLFDFGLRDAARKEAKELSFAANAAFTGVHQKLIFDVTTAYYDLWAATRRLQIQRSRASAAGTIAAAARARRGQQLATVTDVAAAEQVVAQAQFDMTRAQSELAVSSTRLASISGLSPRQPLSPAFPKTLQLPNQIPTQLDAYIADAIQRRPDLQVAFARARAREVHIAAVKAQFAPKIVGSGVVGRRTVWGKIEDSRFGSVEADDERPVAGVFVGLSVPLWSGGAMQQRIAAAESEHDAAVADAEALRNLAEGEIVTAYETLRSSLSANMAAHRLIGTTATGAQAAKARYDQGLATVADVSLAQRALYDAQISEVEAQYSAMTSAAALAFASGQIR